MLGSTKVFRCEPHLGRPLAAWKPKRSDFVMLDVLARQAMAAFDAEERARAWARVTDAAAGAPAARLAAAEEAVGEDGAAAGVLEPAVTHDAAAAGPVDERAGTTPAQQPSPPEVSAAKHDEESTAQAGQAGEQQQDHAEQPVVGHQSTNNTPAPTPASGTALMVVQPVLAGDEDEATGSHTHTTCEAGDRVSGCDIEGGLEQAPGLSASVPEADGPEDAPGLSDAGAGFNAGEGNTARVVVHVGKHDGRIQVKLQDL